MSKVGSSYEDLVEADSEAIDPYNAAHFGPYIENNSIFTAEIMCLCHIGDAQELIHYPNDISDEKAVQLLGKELYELIFEPSETE